MSDRIQVLCGVEAVNPKALLPCLLKTRIVTFGFGSERIKLFERDAFTVDRKTIIIGKSNIFGTAAAFSAVIPIFVIAWANSRF